MMTIDGAKVHEYRWPQNPDTVIFIAEKDGKTFCALSDAHTSRKRAIEILFLKIANRKSD